jgi:monoamine oxidase
LATSAAALAAARPLRATADDGPTPDRRADGTAPRIAIVGAGIAGLGAAEALARAGLHARVFEAGKRPGGRIVTARGALAPGLVTELGGEFIDSGHDELLRLVRRLGLTLIDTFRDPDPSLLRETYFVGGAHHTGAQAVEALRPFAGRVRDDQEAIGPHWGYRRNPRALELDRLSVAEYLDKLGAGGWVRTLIEVAFAAEFGVDCDRLSAINLLILISADLSRGRPALYGDSDERYKVRGGNRQITDGLAAALGRPVELEHRLCSVRAAGDRFRLSFDGPNGRAVAVEADYVVLAIPFSVLRGVELRVELPPLKRRAIDELGYGTNPKLALGFRRPAWRDRGYAGAVFSDEPFRTAWDHGRFQPESGAAALTVFPGGEAGAAVGPGTAAEQAARLLPGLDRVYPGTLAAFNGRAERYHWPSAPYALGSYACYLPGQWTTIAGAEGIPVGGLHFAGEHCLFGDSGYMNSGLASGRACARALLARLRRG